MIRVGARVVLSKDGRKAYKNALDNPHTVAGRLARKIFDEYCYEVEWDNGHWNNYTKGQIEELTLVQLEDLI